MAVKLFSACKDGDAGKIKDLLDGEAYAKTLLNITNTTDAIAKKVGERTIYTAALRGHLEALRVLLQAGANPNVATPLGTPIYGAVKSSKKECVQLLIKQGAEFKSLKGGFSPLHVACLEGKLDILRYLISMGADIFIHDNPPLVFTAAMAGQLDTLRYLMEEMEWDVNRTILGENGQRTDGKDTLLYVACQRKQLEVAGFLVRHGAIMTRTICSTFRRLISHLLQQRFRPMGSGSSPQLYQAKLKELGLAELPWSVMKDYAKTICRLELQGNCLASLPEEIFKHMPSLKVLDVANNQLSELCLEEVKWECGR